MSRFDGLILLILVVVLASIFSVIALAIAYESVAHLLLVAAGVWIAGIVIATADILNARTDAVAKRAQLTQSLSDAVATTGRYNQQYLSRISHELRTPLNSILGYTELALDDADVPADSTARSDIEKVRTAGLDLLALVNDMLAISEPETEESTSVFEPVRIQHLVAEVATLIAPLAERSANRLDVILPEESLMVRIDSRRFERILLALLTNAVKFTRDGIITLDVGAGDNALHIRIADTGIGIDPQHLADISEAFSGSAPAVQTGQNLGLGLSVCKRLVDELGGTITVASEPDHGTSFQIILPAQSTTTDPAARDMLWNREQLDALVIDEVDDSSDLLARYLKKAGCKVTVSNDGAGGKEIAVLMQPALIVLDVDLQSIDGWSVLQHLQFDQRTHDIPVIITSVKNVHRRAISQGARDCLIKPVSAIALKNALIRVGALTQENT